MRAFELYYGKSAEPAEIDVDPFRVREMTSAERAAVIARVLADHPELAELVERLRARDGGLTPSRMPNSV